MSEHVAVIGCGLMGSAIARAFAREGDVVVWNRTPAKAHRLAGPKLRVAESVQDAVKDAKVVVLSLSTYQAAHEALDSVHDWGTTTLVNLITGTPTDAEQFSEWAGGHGVQHLDGAILAYPQDIGTASAMLVYAGPHAVWSAHEQLLMSIGGASRHLSDAIGGAKVFDVALTGAFYTVALGAFLEAAAFADAYGVPVEATRLGAENLMGLLRHDMDGAATAIAAGRYETDQSTVNVCTDAARSWRRAMVDAGQRAALMSAQLDSLEAAQSAGYGDCRFYALFEAAKSSDTTT